MDIAPDGYYDINSTTSSGMGSTPHSWYSGGRGFDLDGGMYKNSVFSAHFYRTRVRSLGMFVIN